MDDALKFTSKGVVSVDVARKKKKQEEEQNHQEETIMTIAYAGSGISPEILPRLFTKFSTRSFGLYISKNIIEVHDGKNTGP